MKKCSVCLVLIFGRSQIEFCVIMTESSKESTTSNIIRRITTSLSSGKKESEGVSIKNKRGDDNNVEYPKWHTVVAGAVAGAGSRLLIAPLDLLKIRWQLGTHGNMLDTVTGIIKQEGGITSLFRGNVAATYLWVGYAAVQFSLYARSHDWFTQMGQIHHQQQQQQKQPLIPLPPVVTQPLHWIGSNPTTTAFCAGATAGIFATMATYPFDIARTTFAARGLTSTATKAVGSSIQKNIPPKTLLEFCKQTYKQGGIRGFYVGSGPAVLQIIPYMGLNFALYDYLSNHNKIKSVLQSGWAGAIAGGTSKLLVYPLDTVKKRLQAQSYFSPSTSSTGKYISTYDNNMFKCIHHIATTEGILSFYRGLVPTVIKNMAATGLTFALFTFTKKNLEAIHDSVQLPDKKEK